MGQRFDFKHLPSSDASGDDVAAQSIPREVLLDLAGSLLREYHRLFAQKNARILELETALRLAVATWRPANSVLQ
jgi:hypothetical protein